MALANQEAQRFNHDYLGTEHVLIAIAKEKKGVGAIYLKDQGLGFNDVRGNVEKLVQSGPDIVTFGKLPQTDSVRTSVEEAIKYAGSFNHDYIGTGHLLAGLVEQGEGTALKVLNDSGLTKEKIKEDLGNLLKVSSQFSK